MNYLILVLFIFLLSCSSDKEKDLIDLEYYMKQGKEINILNKYEFKEIKKVNKLQLSKAVEGSDWLSEKINVNNYLPRFFIGDFKKKTRININPKSFLVIKDKIYIIDESSNLIILNENLKELKRKPIYNQKDFKDYALDFSMTSDGKFIYISDNLGNIHSIELESLKVKWFLELGVPIKSNLYLYNNNLYFVNANSKMYSVKLLNGDINWSHETSSKIIKEQYQITISNNLLITNNDFGEIYCYDLLKKNIIWKLPLSDQNYQIKSKNFKAGYLVSVDGKLYFSSNFGEAFAIEESTGKILWRKLLSSTNLPVINNNYVFFINEKGFFYILNKKDGDVIFSTNLNKFNSEKEKKEIVFYNMILGKNYIYFINSGKSLIKLDINNLNSIKSDNNSINNAKDFFVLNNHLYFLESKALLKFHN